MKNRIELDLIRETASQKPNAHLIARKAIVMTDPVELDTDEDLEVDRLEERMKFALKVDSVLVDLEELEPVSYNEELVDVAQEAILDQETSLVLAENKVYCFDEVIKAEARRLKTELSELFRRRNKRTPNRPRPRRSA